MLYRPKEENGFLGMDGWKWIGLEGGKLIIGFCYYIFVEK
jgi:hypothetical protein